MIIEKKSTNGTNVIFRRITKNQHRLITGKDTLKWFRNRGGSETAKKSYTSSGYVVTRLISTDPTKTIKIERDYIFISFPTYSQGLLFEKLFKSICPKTGMIYLKRFKRPLEIKEVLEIVMKKDLITI